MFSLVPLENIPVAVNCSEKPLATVYAGAVICIESSVALVTVRAACEEELMSSIEAVTYEVPALDAVTRPDEPTELLIDATDASDEFHTTSFVILRVVPSEKTPVAVNCSVKPAATEETPGEISMDLREAVISRDCGAVVGNDEATGA
jgi:hypothetical protein